MAFALSNHSFMSTCFSTSFSKPCKTLEFKTLPLPSLHHHRPRLSTPILGFPLFSSTPILIRRSVKLSLAVEDSAVDTNDEGEDSQNDAKTSESEADEEQLSNLANLIKVYKEAVLDGDQKTASDIEAMICMIENEKNELVEKVSALAAEITSGKEKYIRLQADFDNFRKRSEKDRLTVRSNAQGEVIESLLPMVDNFERAKQQLNPETEKEKKIDTSYQGIYKQFVEIMRSLQVAVVSTVGKPFDPSLHEAIAREESEEFQEGIVIEEFRRGFLLGDRLLRPAMVKVSAGPGSTKAPAATENSTEISTEQTATAAGVDDQ